MVVSPPVRGESSEDTGPNLTHSLSDFNRGCWAEGARSRVTSNAGHERKHQHSTQEQDKTVPWPCRDHTCTWICLWKVKTEKRTTSSCRALRLAAWRADVDAGLSVNFRLSRYAIETPTENFHRENTEYVTTFLVGRFITGATTQDQCWSRELISERLHMLRCKPDTDMLQDDVLPKTLPVSSARGSSQSPKLNLTRESPSALCMGERRSSPLWPSPSPSAFYRHCTLWPWSSQTAQRPVLGTFLRYHEYHACAVSRDFCLWDQGMTSYVDMNMMKSRKKTITCTQGMKSNNM